LIKILLSSRIDHKLCTIYGFSAENSAVSAEMKHPEGKEFYTVKELKDLIFLSERSITDRLKRGEIRGTKFGGKGRWLISSTEVNRLLSGQKAAEELLGLATQLKVQLSVPDPETVLIDDFGEAGHHSFHFKQDVFRVISRNLGYDVSEFRAIKESAWIPSGDLEINVDVSPFGTLELFCLKEEHSSFQSLLSSLSKVAQEQFSTWKQRGGQYLTMCSDIRREIHTEAKNRTFQSLYEAGPIRVGSPPLTPHYGNLIYQLCILYRSGKLGLPDKEQYRIRPSGLVFSRLYLGEIHLANAPNPPPIPAPPRSTKWPHMLEAWADLHRDMILEWSASTAIIELLELFESLRAIKATVKQELDRTIYDKLACLTGLAS